MSLLDDLLSGNTSGSSTMQAGYARRAYPMVSYNKTDITEALKP